MAKGTCGSIREQQVATEALRTAGIPSVDSALKRLTDPKRPPQPEVILNIQMAYGGNKQVSEALAKVGQ